VHDLIDIEMYLLAFDLKDNKKCNQNLYLERFCLLPWDIR